MKQLLFSVTKKDFEIQTFRSGGAGGQNQNKVNSGVRIIHKVSGSVGVARDSRDQPQNRKNAFLRCINTPTFKAWLKMETARRSKGYEDAVVKVNRWLQPQNLKVETLTEKGWKPIGNDS